MKAERSERQETKGRTEFTYGSSTRSVALPEGANEDAIAATYEKGILTIAVPIAAAEASEPKHVTITSTE
ncbi:Hsp20/alpha crystallin family protein [Nocardia aurea]|uniref:Hsp20/alpha crystallin family protein n=1 Tax=Nocardia aurea TaxID=2144174 RepID=A0ABV3FSL3_9NOCA